MTLRCALALALAAATASGCGGGKGSDQPTSADIAKVRIRTVVPQKFVPTGSRLLITTYTTFPSRFDDHADALHRWVTVSSAAGAGRHTSETLDSGSAGVDNGYSPLSDWIDDWEVPVPQLLRRDGVAVVPLRLCDAERRCQRISVPICVRDGKATGTPRDSNGRPIQRPGSGRPLAGASCRRPRF